MIDHLISHIKADDYLLLNRDVPDTALKTDVIFCEAEFDFYFERVLKVEPIMKSALKTALTIDYFLDTPFMEATEARKWDDSAVKVYPMKGLYCSAKDVKSKNR